MPETIIPDVDKQIEAVAKQFDLDSDKIKTVYDSIFEDWKSYTSQEELICLIVFAARYLNSYEFAESTLKVIAETLNDPSKLLHLNQLGITGICDLDKANTELKKNIVSEVFGSRDTLQFLFALSEDQKDENKSFFIKVLFFLAALPVE